MDFDKLNFESALKKAQSLGYAERNPKADLAGLDVADKLRILSALCFNSVIDYKNIYIEGINNIDQFDVQYMMNRSGLNSRVEGDYTSAMD